MIVKITIKMLKDKLKPFNNFYLIISNSLIILNKKKEFSNR